MQWPNALICQAFSCAWLLASCTHGLRDGCMHNEHHNGIAEFFKAVSNMSQVWSITTIAPSPVHSVKCRSCREGAAQAAETRLKRKLALH